MTEELKVRGVVVLVMFVVMVVVMGFVSITVVNGDETIVVTAPPVVLLTNPPPPAATCDTIFASCHTVPLTETASDDPRLVCARPLAIHIFAPPNHDAPVPYFSNSPARVSVILLPKTPVHPSASAAFANVDVATE
jgi:hypothetical protein